jgi:serine/threonine-protein kinase HipA
VAAARAVSLTMPVRVSSYDRPHDLVPIFQMHLPEGALREWLARALAKATGRFDDFDLLAVVGRAQLGRLRFTGRTETLDVDDVPFQSVDDILTARRGDGLYPYLIERFASYSGLSGVQPKVLVRDDGKVSADKVRRSSSVRAATHIVKMWEAMEFPELAANEHACLDAAVRLGLEVPPFALAEDGAALVVERFDLTADGYLGFEDFCVLNGVGAGQKYQGGYETRLFGRAAAYLGSGHARRTGLRDLYRLMVLNCAIRNGDAHLKNFALLYNAVDATPRLAPVYDLVTTVAYLPVDQMALTLEGSTRWPDRSRLVHIGKTRADLDTAEIAAIMEATADALSDAWVAAHPYFATCPTPAVGTAIEAAWQAGIAGSLGLVHGLPRASVLPRPRSRGQTAVLDHLARHGRTYTGTLAGLARAVDLPASTVRRAVTDLIARGRIVREGQTLRLRDGGGDGNG